MGGAHGKPQHIGDADGHHGNEFRSRSLSVSHVSLADLLADGHHNALPADHGSQSQRQRHCDLDPERDEVGDAIDGGGEILSGFFGCR